MGRPFSNRSCDVPGCGRKHKAKGLCNMHLQRFERHGSALADLPEGYKDLPRQGHSIIIEGVECWAMPVTGGGETIVDLCDRRHVDPYRWSQTWGYAVRHVGACKVGLHKIICEVAPGYEVDHINRNRMDNRRCNLRPSTHQQNTFNSTLRKNKSSRFRGVHWNEGKKKWTASIQLNGRKHHVGHFNDEESAARAWNAISTQDRGQFAVLNPV